MNVVKPKSLCSLSNRWPKPELESHHDKGKQSEKYQSSMC